MDRRGIARLTVLIALAATPAMAGFHAPYPEDPAKTCPTGCPDACYTCHLSNPYADGAPLFTDLLDQACTACHGNIAAGAPSSHPSQVEADPTMLAGGDFWWYPRDENGGTLNCASCHDPHLKKTSGNPFLLRGPDIAGPAFCEGCHASTTRHGTALFLAHGKSLTGPPKGNDSALDAVSLECLGCHDGSTGSVHANYCLLGQEDACNGHIVGLDYQTAASGNPGLRVALDPRISLYQGKVGCASCHSIYSDDPMLLVMGNQGSALCLACHLK